jgi:hypothetical protein
VSGRLGGQQRPVQRGLAVGQNRDGLVAVVVGGRDGDVVVAGQLAHPGVVEQQAQHQHRLAVGAQRPGALTGAQADPLGVQQARQKQHAVLGHVQDGAVCDTHSGAEPLCR